MKTNIPKRIPRWVLAVMLIATAACSAQAATQVQAVLINRPVTPGDKSVYSLPAALETSGGLNTVGIGTPVYLDLLITNTVPAGDITSMTWALTNTPIGSVATLTPSPLTTNMPVYEPADRPLYQVGDRRVLRPDVVGQYTVIATVATSGEGTNTTRLTLTAGTYMGVNTCALCHSGGLVAQDMVQPWATTAHSMIFSNAICGYLGSYYSQSCLQCHTVGYDNTPGVNNGNFYNVMQQTGWLFPTVLSPTNWAAMPSSLQNLANIQCENCHGPGSQHAFSLGNTNLITRTVNSGDCNQCHDAPTRHVKGTEWYQSAHAVTTRVPAGSAGCVICHTANGFIARVSGASSTNTDYAAIGCQTCHEPHGQTLPGTNAPNPHLLRTLAPVTLADGTVITNAGEGLLCAQCHHSRQNAATYATSYHPYFGPHEGPQADMLEGANGFTYGQAIPSSSHRNVPNLCVTCHMQPVDPSSPAFLHGGGHTFKVMCDPGGDGVIVNMVAACQQCHGSEFTADSGWNVPVQDYNGDGVIEGVQDEVQNLLDKLSTLLPPDNTVKSSLNIDPTWTTPQLEAAYNWLFVRKDGSLGAHNIAYAVGLLKASIANLTGTSAAGGLPDWWVIQYFGSLTNLNGAPNATPAGDGVPNWMKFALGLNPLIPGTTNAVGGVVWADGNQLGGNFPSNSVAIFTAAEVAFDTQVGTTYWIQAIGSLSEGWQTIAGPIAGTGAAYSYVTPTRRNVQQYFRIVHSP